MLHVLHVTRLNDQAIIPTRGSAEAAGHDLYAAHGALLTPGARALITTGLRIGLPHGTYGRVAPRSGLANKHGVDVLAGVIDRDYQGDVGVILINTSKTETFEVHPGDRIAQLIIEEIRHVEIHELDADGELIVTSRGADGFGSTGQ